MPKIKPLQNYSIQIQKQNAIFIFQVNDILYLQSYKNVKFNTNILSRYIYIPHLLCIQKYCFIKNKFQMQTQAQGFFDYTNFFLGTFFVFFLFLSIQVVYYIALQKCVNAYHTYQYIFMNVYPKIYTHFRLKCVEVYQID